MWASDNVKILVKTIPVLQRKQSEIDFLKNNNKKTSEELFSKGKADENMPTEEIKLSGKINVVDFLSQLSIFNSKSEIRRLIEQNGIMIDDKKVENINENIDLTKKEIIVKKGKKTFLKVKL